jgi:hypothetical protein
MVHILLEVVKAVVANASHEEPGTNKFVLGFVYEIWGALSTSTDEYFSKVTREFIFVLCN